MKKCLLLVFLCLAGIACAQDDEPRESIRRFEGKVGSDLPVTLLLNTSLSEDLEPSYAGTYHYHRTGVPILLSQEVGDGELIVLLENESTDAAGKDTSTGRWEVSFSGDEIKGSWLSPDGKTRLPIALKESYPPGSARIEITSLASSWSRQRGAKETGEENAVSFLQLRGDGMSLDEVNLELRRLALMEAAIDDGEEPAEPPAAAKTPAASMAKVSLEDIEAALKVAEPAEIDWEVPVKSSYTSTMSVLMNEGGFLTVEIMDWSYTGGAHGNYGVAHATFDLGTGREIKLADLVNAGYEKRWTELGAAELRLQAGVAANAPLSEAGLFEDKLELTGNWFLTPGGIGFSYSPYEIASYARGIVEFVLPWKDIIQDLKPGSRVHQLAEGMLAWKKDSKAAPAK